MLTVDTLQGFKALQKLWRTFFVGAALIYLLSGVDSERDIDIHATTLNGLPPHLSASFFTLSTPPCFPSSSLVCPHSFHHSLSKWSPHPTSKFPVKEVGPHIVNIL